MGEYRDLEAMIERGEGCVRMDRSPRGYLKSLNAALDEVADAVRHLVAIHGMGVTEWHDMSPNHLLQLHRLRHLEDAHGPAPVLSTEPEPPR